MSEPMAGTVASVDQTMQQGDRTGAITFTAHYGEPAVIYGRIVTIDGVTYFEGDVDAAVEAFRQYIEQLPRRATLEGTKDGDAP